jgi:hypothetical protein
MITKTFIFTKTFDTYTLKTLRHIKSLRDHVGRSFPAIRSPPYMLDKRSNPKTISAAGESQLRPHGARSITPNALSGW